MGVPAKALAEACRCIAEEAAARRGTLDLSEYGSAKDSGAGRRANLLITQISAGLEAVPIFGDADQADKKWTIVHTSRPNPSRCRYEPVMPPILAMRGGVPARFALMAVANEPKVLSPNHYFEA
jgi:hypothetical protein